MTKPSKRHTEPAATPTKQTRREVMTTMAIAGMAAAFGAPRFAGAEPGPSGNTHDWDWLVGNWDVWHRRLKERLAGSNEWEEFAGKSTLWLTMQGLGTIDDNSLDLPSGNYRGLGIRAFDPEKREWLSWWLDGRNPNLTTPVRGTFKNGVGTFIGDEVSNGKPIKVRSQWSRMTATSTHWEQASSQDGGVTWETNWVSDFERRA